MVVNSVHWFRKGLRLHDNPALQEALRAADTVRCVYILDPWCAGSANLGLNRWRSVMERVYLGNIIIIINIITVCNSMAVDHVLHMWQLWWCRSQVNMRCLYIYLFKSCCNALFLSPIYSLYTFIFNELHLKKGEIRIAWLIVPFRMPPLPMRPCVSV